MNIILGEAAAQQARERYTVLELDSFQIQGHTDVVTAYCVIDHVPLEELALSPSLEALHQTLIENYRHRRWDQCHEAINNLRGHWRGALDTFYDALQQRVQEFQNQEPGSDWDGRVLRAETA